MAKEKIVTQIRKAMKRPDFFSRLAEAQKQAVESSTYLRKAAQLPLNWRDWRVTI